MISICFALLGTWRIAPTWHGNLLMVEDLPKQNLDLLRCIKQTKVSNKNAQSDCVKLARGAFWRSCSPVHALVFPFFSTKWNEDLVTVGILKAAFVLFSSIFTLFPGGCTPAHGHSSGLNAWHLPNKFHGSLPINIILTGHFKALKMCLIS